MADAAKAMSVNKREMEGMVEVDEPNDYNSKRKRPREENGTETFARLHVSHLFYMLVTHQYVLFPMGRSAQ